MWRFYVLVFAVPWVACQNGRDGQHEQHGHGWDIRLAVPGEPGSDYPTLGSIPRTSFSCAGKEPGYYADLETNCQVFRVCTIGATYGFQSFLCPNGTLFNQEVFVCDWWMNVRCEKSEQLFDNNVERFGNLRLGPQLMKDIKKMLTHPMRNPYDQNSMRGNLIVMQDYRPPAGQLFPNEALLSGPERPPNNVYVPAKQIQAISQNDFNDNNDLVFAASTPEPRYLPAAFNTIQPSTQDAEVFQKQRQNSRLEQRNGAHNIQNQRANLVSNGHSGRVSQNTNVAFPNNIAAQQTQPTQPTQPIRLTQNYDRVSTQFGQKQKSNSAFTANTQSAINSQQGHFNAQYSQYTDNKLSQLNSEKQVDLGLARQQNNLNNNQGKQSYTYNTPTPGFTNEINGQFEAKQNLVSTSNPPPKPTIIAKTLTFSRLVDDPKPGKPKSRITVKTWIVKPSKSGKLISPTPYTYNRPTRTPTEKIIDSTPYFYNKPTAFTQTERLVTETEQPYFYNRPTVPAKQLITTREPPQTYPSPTAPRPTFSGRQYLAPNVPTPSPTRASLLYLPPTTFKPAAKIYLPPTENETPSPVILSRQYLAPNPVQPTYFPGEQLRQAPTTAATRITFATTTSTSGPDFSFTKQSQVNTNHNNLTFSDILTKEKLDVTVNDIVKDTSKLLNSASSAQFGKIIQDVSSIDYPADIYLPPEQSVTDSGEILTSQTPVNHQSSVSKSAKLKQGPSVDLEPPVESQENYHITNQLSNLPFFKEPPPPTNTIERTVSLKISIPEKVANYLFNRQNESDFNRLEILNTGSSNYLVLTNNPFVKPTETSFIPIGKLISDKNTNISNSQALVFSLLADSINVAKEYSNLAKQDTKPSTPLMNEFQDSEDVSPITTRISQLTSAQFGSNNANNAKIVSTTQATPTANQFIESANDNLIQDDIKPSQLQQPPTSPPQRTQSQYSAKLQNPAVDDVSSGYPYPINSQNQIYSGQLYQLPVPVVTSQIYNRDNSANLVLPNIYSQNKNLETNYKVGSKVLKNSLNVKNVGPYSSPARLQVSPSMSNDRDIFDNQKAVNDFLVEGNGIAAQIQDQISGTIQHPVENTKLLNYKKYQTSYVYTKINNGINENIVASQPIKARLPQNAKLIQSTNTPKVVTFQFIPSVSYQLEDEKDQQKILNAFQIDQFGSPRLKSNQIQDSNQGREILTSDISYTIDHTPSKQVSGQYNDISTLYNGPSSYSAPQASIGNLRLAEVNYNSKLELENNENNNGYPRIVPARQFNF